MPSPEHEGLAELFRIYWDLVLGALSEAARAALEAMMLRKQVRYTSEIARRYDAQGKASAVLEVLDARNVPVTETIQSKISACTDPEVVRRWIRKAAVLTRVDELFEDDLYAT